MKYLNKSFSSAPNSKIYRDNYDNIFKKKEKKNLIDIIKSIFKKRTNKRGESITNE
jgi:hypothetical protein